MLNEQNFRQFKENFKITTVSEGIFMKVYLKLKLYGISLTNEVL